MDSKKRPQSASSRSVKRGQKRMEEHRKRVAAEAAGTAKPVKKTGWRALAPIYRIGIIAAVLLVIAVAVVIAVSARNAAAEKAAAEQAAASQAEAAAAAAAEQAAAEAAAAAEENQPIVQRNEQESTQFADTLATYCSLYDVYNTGKDVNLQLACEALTGTVLQPGEVFSFNDIVGERTAEKGYQEASAYIRGNIVPELGGGICQVASTIYYCVLYACLEVVERSPHQYIVTYVPGGMDATVYWGDLDFKFANSTDHPIRIDAKAGGGECWVTIKGIASEKTITVLENELVSTNEPKIIENQNAGEDVDGITGYTYRITRKIYDTEGILISNESSDDLGILGYSVYSKRDAIHYTG